MNIACFYLLHKCGLTFVPGADIFKRCIKAGTFVKTYAATTMASYAIKNGEIPEMSTKKPMFVRTAASRKLEGHCTGYEALCIKKIGIQGNKMAVGL